MTELWQWLYPINKGCKCCLADKFIFCLLSKLALEIRKIGFKNHQYYRNLCFCSWCIVPTVLLVSLFQIVWLHVSEATSCTYKYLEQRSVLYNATEAEEKSKWGYIVFIVWFIFLEYLLQRILCIKIIFYV